MPKLRSPWTRLALAAVLATAASGAALAANTITVPTCPNSSRFGGNCGALVTINSSDTSAAFVQDNSPAAEETYNVRFYVNTRALKLVAGNEMDLFGAYDGADPAPASPPGNAILRVFVSQIAGGAKKISVEAKTDSSTATAGPFGLQPGYRDIEIHWSRGAGPSTGSVSIWIDGKPKTGLSSLTQGSAIKINHVRWGALAFQSAPNAGSMSLDDFASQRTGNVGPVAPFADIPFASAFWPFTQAVYQGGVMTGCGGGNFCPNTTITRGQMAQMTLLARYGGSHVPGPCSVDPFTDVACSDPLGPWINEFKQLGYTTGFPDGSYKPNNSLTRGEMSVFLAYSRQDIPTPACDATHPGFSDVPVASPFCPYIRMMVENGITAGKGDGTYGINDPVNRGANAVFMTQTCANVNAELAVPLDAP